MGFNRCRSVIRQRAGVTLYYSIVDRPHIKVFSSIILVYDGMLSSTTLDVFRTVRPTCLGLKFLLMDFCEISGKHFLRKTSWNPRNACAVFVLTYVVCRKRGEACQKRP